jgi:REP element-mobilizing transposase RayT
VALDTFVVMPNHAHGIVVITEMVGAKNFSPLPVTHSAMRPPSKTIGSIIRGFKIGATKWFRGNTNIYTIWQRNYYEHIIRDEDEMNRFREYIVNNPLKWAMDENNPADIK